MFSIAILRLLIIKTMAVVLHTQLYAPRIKFQVNKNVSGLGVSHRIVYGFLSDAKKIALNDFVCRSVAETSVGKMFVCESTQAGGRSDPYAALAVDRQRNNPIARQPITSCIG